MAKLTENEDTLSGEIRHLPRRDRMTENEDGMRKMELRIAGYFREQNKLLQENNNALTERIQRLTNGVENLVNEMHGVRTGSKDEAFARVTGADMRPDLPSVSAEAALIYTHTSKTIGNILGFHCSQIGLLLSPKGLNWAGNGDYQEIGRIVSASQSKFWHRDLPTRLQKILDENKPEKYGIRNKTVLAIFKRWHERKQQVELLGQLETSDQPH